MNWGTGVDSFIHLDVKSDYSFFQGASKIDDLVARCLDLGMSSLALTDSYNLYGAYDFSKKATAKGVLPVIGSEVFINYSVRDERRNRDIAKKGTLTLLAQNEQGYRNLCALVSAANRSGRDGETAGVVKVTELLEKRDGIILLSGGEEGILYSMLRDDLDAQGLELAAFFQQTFGDRFYIQVSRHSRMTEQERNIEKRLLGIAFNDNLGVKLADGDHFSGVPLIASTPVRYTDAERHEAWEIMRAIQQSRHLQYVDGTLTETTSRRYAMLSPQEMNDLFRDLPEAMGNARALPQRLAFSVEDRKPILPAFNTEENRNEAEELRHQAEQGLAARLEKEGITDEAEIARYRERLDYELKVIENMGFPGYFLIVADFIQWSRSQGIPVGPGRGSGAGSVVAWALTITDLNPFRFGLLFERFLNPDRVSMPDFDIDFCQDRREEVIRYVSEKYGLDHVAQIANFGEIKSKTAIKDAARVIVDDVEGGFGFNEVNDLTAMIPRKEDSADPKSLVEAYQTNSELANRINSSKKLRLLYGRAHLLEGLYRSQGLHAAGIVIADRPLHELAPIGWDPDTDLPVTQFNMKAAESVGLVKFDFLGLKTLSVIKKAVDLIREFQGKDIDIEAIPLDDPAVYSMMAEGKSIGVFQFESEGMQRVLRQVRPTRIEDLIAVNALFRPGPMSMIDDYAACKRGEKVPHYPDPVDKTKPFLEETFGIMVYQEQVMQVAQVVAGYSLGEADLLRRAMGKKIKEEMDAQKEKFIKGAVERGTAPEAAEELFHHIEKFASYGFNKSHAAAYAVIAYRTAWLKRHYPVEFFSALMSYETSRPDRMALIRDDMEEHPDGKIELLPPDVSCSHSSFRPEQHKDHGYAIRFGLEGVKGISGDLGYLVEEQKKKPFSDLVDFYRRAGHRMNKGQLDKLAEVGAFDSIHPVRSQAQDILGWLSKNWDPVKAQNDLFSDYEITIPPHLKEREEWGDISDREFRAVGFWFGKHPIDPYMPRLRRSPADTKRGHMERMIERGLAQIQQAYVCVMIEDVRVKESRNGNHYLLLRAQEKKDAYFISMFRNRGDDLYEIYDRLDALKRARSPVIIECNIAFDRDGEDIRLFGRDAHDIDTWLEPYRGSLHIVLDSSEVFLTNDEFRDMEAAGDDETAKAEVWRTVTRRKLREINTMLDETRQDGHPAATSILMEVRAPGFKVVRKMKSGFYRITPAVESHIKSIDGIVSIRETETPLEPESRPTTAAAGQEQRGQQERQAPQRQEVPHPSWGGIPPAMPQKGFVSPFGKPQPTPSGTADKTRPHNSSSASPSKGGISPFGRAPTPLQKALGKTVQPTANPFTSPFGNSAPQQQGSAGQPTPEKRLGSTAKPATPRPAANPFRSPFTSPFTKQDEREGGTPGPG